MRLHIHVGLVVRTNLLDSYVVLGVNKRFCGGVGLGESHDTGYVLELTVIVHLHLSAQSKRRNPTKEQTLGLFMKANLSSSVNKKTSPYLSNPRVGVPNLHDNRK